MSQRNFWSQHREASLSWIAFGLLLAAWNASADDPRGGARASAAATRPVSLRTYPCISVRAVAQHSAVIKAST
jgi:hypothetical protein